MVEHVRSTATQVVQIWVNRTTNELGWNGPLKGTDRYLGGVYGQDLTSYCDFSDLIAEECWPDENRPRGFIYFIGALSDPEPIPAFDDHDYPLRARERVRWMAVQQLRNVGGLLAGAATSPIDPRSFDFSMLIGPDVNAHPRGVNAFDSQYWRANIDPNERYTLSLANSVQYRLDAWNAQFTILVIAGDWINTGWNVGSFEGATMGGKLASLAISGAPSLQDIWGYSFLQSPVPEPTPQIPRSSP